MSPLKQHRPLFTEAGCLASIRTRLGLWLDKAHVLLQQAFSVQITGHDLLDAQWLEPTILYSASTAVVMCDVTDFSEMKACDFIAPTQQVVSVPIVDLVVIDARVSKLDQLIADIQAAETGDHRVEILTLDRGADAVEQITARLEQLQNVGSIQIFSHGNDGQLLLGKSLVDAANLDSYANAFSEWKTLVNHDADLLIYSCDVAASDRGVAMLQRISDWTGMDVTASRDLTGALTSGANWSLEFTIGEIQSRNWMSPSLQASWTELLPTIQVTTFDDVVDGNTSSIAALLASPGADQSISLREAILATNATSGADVIVLASGTYRLEILGANENHSDTGDINITDDLEILGAGTKTTIIDGLGNDRLFTVGNQSSVTISGMTLTGGTAQGNPQGGTILVNNSSALTLANVRIHQSSAITGGAIYVDQSTLVLTGSQLDHNQAVMGGAIYNRSGSVNITASSLALNSATQRGGAIYNDANGLGLQLTNVTLSTNTANVQGGAIYTKGNAAIQQSTIAFNQSNSTGGLAISSGTVTLQNSILADNIGGNASGSLQSLGNNLSDVSLAALNQPSDLVGNVGLLPLGNYGGHSWSHALAVGSTAIDAAAPGAATTIDQRGFNRDANSRYRRGGISTTQCHHRPTGKHDYR